MDLLATLKFQPALDASLEAKAIKFLKSVTQKGRQPADAFLGTLASSSDESMPDFVRCIAVLISSASQAITAAAMDLLYTLIDWCSVKIRLALVKADLIPELIISLNPLSLSFIEAVNIHTYLMHSITHSLYLATPDGLRELRIKDGTELQAVHKTVLKQVLIPSEKYIWHLCVNRYSIVNGDQSENFLRILSRILAICPYYLPAMDFVLNMPVLLMITSCLTFFENEHSIFCFLYFMINAQRDYNQKWGDQRHMWKTVHKMLRMEGFEDVIKEKLRNDKNGNEGGWIVDESIEWNNLLGMNLPKRE
ncbi:hypothetical protein BLNAU_1630 [Blattamonas nauphoetae]|uniref:Uncharacterized protein n=1 Tax=Blattamonas nauphoetae TaxID=2049346 RepID=A0ABQ9YIK1_9EUKA|nr:hypothetical protein BLNAU_1630 [Blattamonas nauphoetae]